MNAPDPTLEQIDESKRHVAMVRDELHKCSGRHCAGCGSHLTDRDFGVSCSACNRWHQIMRGER